MEGCKLLRIQQSQVILRKDSFSLSRLSLSLRLNILYFLQEQSGSPLLLSTEHKGIVNFYIIKILSH